MTTTPKHTPLPFELDEDYPERIVAVVKFEDDDDDTEIIATFEDTVDCKGWENAAFAIKAMNSHYTNLARIDELEKELSSILDHYVSLAGCGDCGNWDPETEPKVISARQALEKK